MVHTATTKYASHIDTRVYLYIGDDEWEIDCLLYTSDAADE